MSEQNDKVFPPTKATNTVVILTETRKDTAAAENRIFNSVAAAAVYFAYVARRVYSQAGLHGNTLLEAIAADTAVLFAGYDNTTGNDRTAVLVDGVKYEAKLTAVLDEALAAADGRAGDAEGGK